MKIKQKDIAILFTGKILKQFKKKIIGAKIGKVSSMPKSVNSELAFIVADRDVSNKELKNLLKTFKTICAISNQKYTLLNSISSSYIVNNTYTKIVYLVLRQIIECFSKPSLVNLSLNEIIEFFKKNKEVSISYQKYCLTDENRNKQITNSHIEHLKSTNILILIKCGSNIQLEDITELGDTLLKNVSETAAVFWTCDATGKEKNRVEVVVVANRKIRK